MDVEAEVSLYPLGEEDLGRGVMAFIDTLRDQGCRVEVGDMSSQVSGDSETVFAALRVGYERAARAGGCVLVVKACNVCAL